MSAWWMLGVGAILILAMGIFVAAEFSLVSLDRPSVEAAAESGDRRAAGVLVSVRSLSTQLSGAQVGITITSLSLGFLVEPALAQVLKDPLTQAGVPASALGAVTIALAMFVATVVSMVLGELVPQNLAFSRPLPTARYVAGPNRMFTRVAGPLIVLLNRGADFLLKVVGVEPQEELRTGRSAEELMALVQHSAEVGTMDQSVATLITRSLEFGERTAADVMTPRVRVEVVQQQDSCLEVVRQARGTGYSRFPVIDEDADSIVGVVHLKAVLAVPAPLRPDTPVASLMVDPLRVPETIRLEPLLAQLRAIGLQMAIVVDEYGGTAGVVTLEDLVEELVGEVSDEHDRARAPGVLSLTDGTWSIPGLLRPDEASERIGISIPDGPDYETVAGYVVALLGRIPAHGDKVEGPGFVATVERMDGRRVDRVRIEPIPEAESDVDES